MSKVKIEMFEITPKEYRWIKEDKPFYFDFERHLLLNETGVKLAIAQYRYESDVEDDWLMTDEDIRHELGIIARDELDEWCYGSHAIMPYQTRNGGLLCILAYEH